LRSLRLGLPGASGLANDRAISDRGERSKCHKGKVVEILAQLELGRALKKRCWNFRFSALLGKAILVNGSAVFVGIANSQIDGLAADGTGNKGN
jgi:hypothetical protein